jgi:hypothetical protein
VYLFQQLVPPHKAERAPRRRLKANSHELTAVRRIVLDDPRVAQAGGRDLAFDLFEFR